jgi:enoyl-CoA hydratase/carnithine racemase
MPARHLATTQSGSAFIIQFNRPERRNAISTQTMDELVAAARYAEVDPVVRGLVITGGNDYFSAGADLHEPLAIASATEALAYLRRWHALCDVFETLPKPVIAAIEGFCMTGGCELAMACDIRIAAEDSVFAITSSKIGTVAGAGGPQRLARLVGPAKALEIMFAGDPISAQEAKDVGLVNRVVAKGATLKEAKAMIRIYEKRAPLSLAFVKRTVHRGLQMDLASALDFESFLCATLFTTEDRKEGISAFLEKRTPVFKGT